MEEKLAEARRLVADRPGCFRGRLGCPYMEWSAQRMLSIDRPRSPCFSADDMLSDGERNGFVDLAHYRWLDRGPLPGHYKITEKLLDRLLGREAEAASARLADAEAAEAAGLTVSEAAVVDRLADAWNLFVALPELHASHREEFCRAVHAGQWLVWGRPAYRRYAERPRRVAPPTGGGASSPVHGG